MCTPHLLGGCLCERSVKQRWLSCFVVCWRVLRSSRSATSDGYCLYDVLSGQLVIGLVEKRCPRCIVPPSRRSDLIVLAMLQTAIFSDPTIAKFTRFYCQTAGANGSVAPGTISRLQDAATIQFTSLALSTDRRGLIWQAAVLQ